MTIFDKIRAAFSGTRSSAVSGNVNKEILAELRKINTTMKKFEKCISLDNRRNRMSVRTGRWNDFS